MATSAARRILHIETPQMSSLNPKQLGFETDPQLSYSSNTGFTSGFWGGKNSYGDVTRFAGFDQYVKFPRIYFGDSITLSTRAPADEQYGVDTRADGSINIGYIAGIQATNPAINIGEQAGYNTVNGILTETCVHIGWHTAWTAQGGGLISIGNEANYGVTGSRNIGVGANTNFDTTGNDNISIGRWCGQKNTGSDNLFMCQLAGQYVDGDYNVCIGWGAGSGGLTDPTAINNTVIIGKDSGLKTSGDSNIIIGRWAGVTLSGDTNVCVGEAAGSNVVGSDNVFIGDDAGYGLNGTDNCVIGEDAAVNFIGDDNIIIGEGSGYNSSGDGNIIIGQYAGEVNKLSSDGFHDNITIGQNSLSKNITPSFNNVSIGNYTLLSAGFQQDMVALGTSAGYRTEGHSYSVAIGREALFDSQSISSRTVSIGYKSGYQNDGVRGTYIGELAGYQSSGDNCVFIGTSAGYQNTTGEQFVLGNVSNTLIYGDFSTQRVNIKYLNLIPSSAPGTPSEGDLYYDSGTNKLRMYNGSGWETVTSS